VCIRQIQKDRERENNFVCVIKRKRDCA
jgi:hypothetical protein